MSRLRLVGAGIALVLSVGWLGISKPIAVGPNITLTPFSTSFNNPIGIDFFEPIVGSGQLLTSVNYPTGDPHNFDLIDALGNHTQFTTVAGVKDEVKIATVRTGVPCGGFVVGTAFSGNGVPGQVMKINPDGTTVNPWVTLPGETADVRGSLYHDRTCVWGGDLIVATGNEQNGGPGDFVGNVWRINSAGVPTLVAQLHRHLEGVLTLPNDATKFGPLAGRIVAGDEDLISPFNTYGPNGRVFGVASATDIITVGQAFVHPDLGLLTNYPTGVALHPEDLDLVLKPRAGLPGDGDLFAVDFGNQQILTAPAADFSDKCDQVLVSQEFPFGAVSAFSTLRWDAASSAFVVTPLVNLGTPVGHLEHVTVRGGTDCTPPPPPPGVSHGCTPGFWKTHASNPPWGSFTPSQTIGSVFTIPSGIPSQPAFTSESLLTALAGGGGSGLDGKTRILLRAAVAAVLNADNGNPPYPLTVTQIVNQTNAALASLNQTTITNLGTTLDNFNNACDR